MNQDRSKAHLQLIDSLECYTKSPPARSVRSECDVRHQRQLVVSKSNSAVEITFITASSGNDHSIGCSIAFVSQLGIVSLASSAELAFWAHITQKTRVT